MEEISEKTGVDGRPDEFWRRVYIAVIFFTFLVITALWAFSRYFSS